MEVRHRPKLILLMMVGALGFALGIMTAFTKTAKKQPIEVPEGSNARIDANGEVEVTLPSETNSSLSGPPYIPAALTGGERPSAAKPTPGTTSLAEAIRVFNARAKDDRIGRNQPPLTQDEVIAAIRWSLLEPDKLAVSDKTLEALKKITVSRELPGGFELEVLTSFQPNNEMEVTKWSVRLQIPAQPQGTTCVDIREVPISSRLFGTEERKVIEKWQKKWAAEGMVLRPDQEYEEERARAVEIDRSQKADVPEANVQKLRTFPASPTRLSPRTVSRLTRMPGESSPKGTALCDSLRFPGRVWKIAE